MKFSSLIYQILILIYRFLPFKRQLCLLIKKSGIPNNKFYKDLKFKGPFKVKLEEGNSFKMFHYGGTIENETFWKGLFNSWEEETGWIWKELCKTSEVIFDIGANTGIYSLTAKALNPKAKVYAFEPSVITFEKLVNNSIINGFDIYCEQVALSNITGEQIFYDTYETNQTSASLSPEKLKYFKGFKGKIREYKVKTDTLSDFIHQKDIKKIDLMKIDVEMHEPEVIEGLKNYLEEFEPIVIIEVLSQEVADKLNQIIGEEYIKVHLTGKNKENFCSIFSPVPGRWNFLFFHNTLLSKIFQNTSLSLKGLNGSNLEKTLNGFFE